MIEDQDFNYSELADKPLYFYVGAGLSMDAGITGWSQMVQTIHTLKRKYEKQRVQKLPTNPSAMSKYLNNFIQETYQQSSKKNLKTFFGRTVLLNLLLRHNCVTGKPILDSNLGLHRMIWETKCHGVLTTNYDMLLERAYNKDLFGELRSYKYTAKFLGYILSNPHFVLKLHGDINDIGTMIFDPNSAWKKKSIQGKKTTRKKKALYSSNQKENLKKLYELILSNGNIIYIGCGFSDGTIKSLHKNLNSTRIQSNLRVALMPKHEIGKLDRNSNWDDIKFIGYDRKGKAEVVLEEFLWKIISARKKTESIHYHFNESKEMLKVMKGEPLEAQYLTEPWTTESKLLQSFTK